MEQTPGAKKRSHFASFGCGRIPFYDVYLLSDIYPGRRQKSPETGSQIKTGRFAIIIDSDRLVRLTNFV